MTEWDKRAGLLLIWLCGILGNSEAMVVLALVGVGFGAGGFFVAFLFVLIGSFWNRK